jgi:antitoxin (DNA-binding transcriptional repressor) of toxin-antitoxin stability system
VYTLIHKLSNAETALETTKVGIREFRTDLAEYIASNAPVAVTRHGQTVGYFIPAHGQSEADLAALKRASETLDRLLNAKGVDPDQVVADFKTIRKGAAKQKTSKAKAA